ncbi:hypothetical protein AYK26_04500 [Euryarchaeota archaeon SM23-78]|nr:MAG: hypothetical protein AYK26_04500 [Euryarchaeota archaeon SM23-78]
MALDYKGTFDISFKMLETAHDPNQAKIRAYFFEKENEFFRKHIRNQKVLVAGSGLGHDSFELARYNKQVIGIELHEPLVEIAKKRAQELGLKNVEFRGGDFTQLDYKDKSFDSAVLNMGTIGTLEDKVKAIKELLRIANLVYLDFYPPTQTGLQIRKKMYEEEKWKNVRINDTRIVSDDGLDSIPISKKEMSEIVNSINARVKYYPLCDFAVMAEITV